MMKQTFKKAERLCSKKTIERLFEKGSTETKTSYLFPFKVFYLFDSEVPSSQPPQVLFTISKRNFKKAVLSIPGQDNVALMTNGHDVNTYSYIEFI